MSKVRGKWFADNTVQEIPAGTVNGVNVTFTLSVVPAIASSLKLKLDSRPLYITTDYTLSGNTITMVVAPAFGQQLDAEFLKK